MQEKTKPVSDSAQPHPGQDSDVDEDSTSQLDLIQQVKLHLDDKSRRLQELKKNLKDKDEELANQSNTIEELRNELTQVKEELAKEKMRSAELQDNLEKAKERKLELENKNGQIERYFLFGVKRFFGGEEEGEGPTVSTEVNEAGELSAIIQEENAGATLASLSSSSSGLAAILTPESVVQQGTLDEPPRQPQQNLKRKARDEEDTGTDMNKLKRTPKAANQHGFNVTEGKAMPGPPDQNPIVKQGSSTAPPTLPAGSQSKANPELPILPATGALHVPPIPTSPSATSIESPSDLPKLPPLVFQFQSTQIKMGMFIEGRPQILMNASGSDSTPFIVGISSHGTLAYGDGVISILDEERDRPQPNSWRCFRVANHLIKCGNDAWSVSAKLQDGKRHKITVEFLIGFILKNLKTTVEARMKGTCPTAVITVPFWYSSSQRIQVKNGVRLAGFSQVYLINEGAAAVFACPSRDNMISPSHNILVLSENSHQIDASIYSYNSYTSSGAKRLIMIGHCGHYSPVETGAAALEGFCQVEAAIVQSLCQEALQYSQDKKHNPVGDTSPPLELITISESQKCAPILEQVGKQFVTTFQNLDVDHENAVVIGAAILSQKPEGIQTIISDKLAHAVLAKCEFDRSPRSIIPKEKLCQSRIITHTFPPRCQVLKVFQRVLDRPVELFRISMKHQIPSSQRILISLNMTGEGIVKFKDMVYTSTYRNKPVVEKAGAEDYIWKAPNLSLDDLKKAKTILALHPPILQTETSMPPEPVDTARQTLLQTCVEMKEKLAFGTLQLKSDLIRDALAKDLEFAGGIAWNPNSAMEEVQVQMDILAKWSVHDQ